MMTRFTFALLMGCLQCLPTLAQQPDTAQMTVHYQFTHLRDTLNRQNAYTENMELLVGTHTSLYRSYDRKMRRAQMQSQLAEQIKNSTGGSQNFNMKSSGGPVSRTEYYYFFPERKVYRKEQLVNNYIVEEPMDIPQWKVGTDTLTIGGLHCQKATTHFKGRDYEAWFAPDLPFRTGPWKLTGLPGLIVQATDRKNDVVFKFTGIENTDRLNKKTAVADQGAPAGSQIRIIGFGENDNQPENVIALPAGAVKTSEKELTRLKDMMEKDPQAFIQASIAGSGMSFSRPGGSPPVIKIQRPEGGFQKPVLNNPLELPESRK